MRLGSRIHEYIAAAVATVLLASCGNDVTGPPAPPPPAPVLLKDIVIPHLPSPYYHFEYGADHRITSVSFASGLRAYDVRYDGARIGELRSNAPGNTDRLRYFYDDAGRVSAVQYVDGGNQIFTNVFLRYTGGRLTEFERDVRVSSGFLVEKVMTFSYDADGNVSTIAERRRTESGPETVTVDTYEQYDHKVNVDAFCLVHDDFFDHVVLLPGVSLQRGNPGRVTHTGDGVNYVVDYTYTYDGENRPLVKSGDLLFTNGTNAGQRFATRSEYSYY